VLETPVTVAPATSSALPPHDHRAEFLVAMAGALATYGATANRLENAIAQCARRLGVKAQIFAMPTGVFASISTGGGEVTHLLRVESAGVNLERLAALQAIIAQVAAGTLSPAEGTRRIAVELAAPPRYGRWITALAFGASSAAVSTFFGGGWREALSAAGVGLVLGALAVFGGSRPRWAWGVEFAAGAVAALLSMAAAEWLEPLSPQTVMLAGLIVLLPGLALTLGMNELATRHLVAGTARLLGAAMTFLLIVFGVAIGQKAGAALQLTAGGASEPLGAWAQPLSLVLIPWALMVLFRGVPRDVPWMTASVVLAFYAARTAGLAVGPELGATGGALVAGVASNLYARITDKPAAVTLLPALVILVPGAVGLLSLTTLMGKNVVMGVETAVTMFVVVVALVVGLLLANAVLPPRRAL
jgi:uncharacterized membrane protein YjjP (DUF1212 family)